MRLRIERTSKPLCPYAPGPGPACGAPYLQYNNAKLEAPLRFLFLYSHYHLLDIPFCQTPLNFADHHVSPFCHLVCWHLDGVERCAKLYTSTMHDPLTARSTYRLTTQYKLTKAAFENRLTLAPVILKSGDHVLDSGTGPGSLFSSNDLGHRLMLWHCYLGT